MVTLASQSISVSVKVQRTKSVALRSVQTTGSISAASTSLTVADASEFSVNDWVIVETGGESGAGARGTKGVGGTWPALSYADAAAMNADTSQVDARACWLEDSGDVYYYSTSSSTWTQVILQGGTIPDYYLQKAIPRALVAQITAISGNVLTLSLAASATATNANVYFDNWGILQDATESVCTLALPAGTFHVSCHVYATDCRKMTIRGQGQTQTILKSPKGASNAGIYLSGCYGSTIRDLQIDQNFKNANYTMHWNNSRVAQITSVDIFDEKYRNATGWGDGINVTGSGGTEVVDCRFMNPCQHAFVTQFNNDVWIRRCTVVVEDPHRTYTQWMIQFPDVTGGGAEDCVIDANWLTSGYNIFKSRNVTLRRCEGRNAIVANNASDGCTFEDLYLLYENASGGLSHINGNQPAFEFSTNVSGGFNTNTSYVINPTLIQEGVPSDVDNKRLRCFVVTSGSSCPVEISGTYDTDSTAPKGLFDVQGSPTGVDGFEGLGIRSSGDLTVEGIRIKGTPPTGKTSMVHTEGGTLNITNSIFDASTPTGTATITASGNQTNAEYEA